VIASPAGLAMEAEAARAEFLEAVSSLTPAQRDAPSLIGDWGLPEIVAHVGYWVGNSAEALHAAEQGRAHELPHIDDVEERNAVVARVAHETDLATVIKREAAAFEAFIDRLRAGDPEWLGMSIASGQTIEHIVKEDGIDHYREHAADLRKAGGDA
jgi:uncharacterized protein with NRDE domain